MTHLPHSCINRPTIRIFDEKKEALALQRQASIDIIDSRLTIEQSNDNIELTCELATSCYLNPKTVLITVNYWLTHYTDYFTQEKDWFNQMITSLLQEGPLVRATAGEMTASANKRHMRLQLMIRFAGTDKFYIPLEYYTNEQQFSLPYRFCCLFDTERRCFRTRTTDSLEGNITLSSFNYDAIMTYFYEPSFLIMTAYLLHLMSLVHNTEGQAQSDYLPRYMHSLEAINPNHIDWEKVRFTDSTICPAIEKLPNEIRRLYDALYVTNLDQALINIKHLWEEKASTLESIAYERTKMIHNRFFSTPF